LPKPLFPEKKTSDLPRSYQLETANGALPRFPDRAKVFLIPKQNLTLLADQRVKEIAANLGFAFEPVPLSERRYRWTKSSPIDASLEIDLQSNRFVWDTGMLSQPELDHKKRLIQEDGAGDFVKQLVVTAVRTLPDDVATASATVRYEKVLGGQVSDAVSYSDADLLRVDVQRVPVDDRYPVYGPDGQSGAYSALLSGAFTGFESVVHMENNYRPVDYLQMHTYPLRSVTAAWQQLQSGLGYVAQKGRHDVAVIRDVSLGYYDDYTDGEYLQPIYVFQGDGGFIGFVPAVDVKWLGVR
jgi:hypothetical protein